MQGLGWIEMKMLQLLMQQNLQKTIVASLRLDSVKEVCRVTEKLIPKTQQLAAKGYRYVA
jgi:hypothetical protein